MRSWLKSKIRRRAVVYLVDDQIFDGWLSEVAGDGIVLTDTIVRANDSIPLPGDTFVPRDRIRFIQFVRSTER